MVVNVISKRRVQYMIIHVRGKHFTYKVVGKARSGVKARTLFLSRRSIERWHRRAAPSTEESRCFVGLDLMPEVIDTFSIDYRSENALRIQLWAKNVI